MDTTYGAPTGLDLSACSVTATGGTTSQTLADLGKDVGDNATAISVAQSVATDAKTASDTATTNVATLTTTVNNLDTKYIPQTSIGVANGVVGTDSGNGIIVPNTVTGDGFVTYNPVQAGRYCHVWFRLLTSTGTEINAPTLNADFVDNHLGIIGDYYEAGNKTFIETVTDCVQPFHGTCDLGATDSPWANIYSKTAVQVTSDANEKTVAGSLGDTTYSDGQKLATALFGLDSCLYQLNSSIASKGAANARLHAGFIAQQVEAAITAAGLDPSKFSLWTNTPLIEVVKTDTGKKDADGNEIYSYTRQPKLDSKGNQVYGQMLRYEELFSVLFEACKAKINEQESAITDLTTRVAALEAKAGA